MKLVFVSVPEPVSRDGKTINGQNISDWRRENRGKYSDELNEQGWVEPRAYYWTWDGHSSFYSVPIKDDGRSAQSVELCRVFFEERLGHQVERFGAVEMSKHGVWGSHDKGNDLLDEFLHWNSPRHY